MLKVDVKVFKEKHIDGWVERDKLMFDEITSKTVYKDKEGE